MNEKSEIFGKTYSLITVGMKGIGMVSGISGGVRLLGGADNNYDVYSLAALGIGSSLYVISDYLDRRKKSRQDSELIEQLEISNRNFRREFREIYKKQEDHGDLLVAYGKSFRESTKSVRTMVQDLDAFFDDIQRERMERSRDELNSLNSHYNRPGGKRDIKRDGERVGNES